MSFQRVFESARRMGIPVVVTDPAGRDPMVLLPLEQFEALSDVGTSGARSGVTTKSSIVASQEPTIQKNPEIRPDPIAELSKEEQESFKAIVLENPEISLEERFYFEPTDRELEG